MKYIQSSEVVNYVNELFIMKDGFPTDKQARWILALARKHNVDAMYAIAEVNKAWKIMPFEDVVGKIVSYIEGEMTIEDYPNANSY